MSRFDLLFVVTDDVDETRDRKIADHVLRMHRYLPAGVEEGTPIVDSLTQSLAVEGPNAQAAEAENVDPSPFEKFDPLIHFGIIDDDTPATNTRNRRRQKETSKEVLSIAFVKKYIQYAKSKPAPVLTKAAADYIVNVYSTLRNEHLENNQKRVSYCGIILGTHRADHSSRRPH